MKKTIQLSIALSLMLSVAVAQSKKVVGPLDKKVYACDITEEGKKKAPEPVKDELKFTGGKFQCKLLLDEGYQATIYEATIDSSTTPYTTSFTAEAKGEKEGDYFKWDGTITEEAVEGTAAIFKKGKQKKSFVYSGTLKGKKAKK